MARTEGETAAAALDTVLAPLDWMRVRVVGRPADLAQAKWAGRTGEVIAVNKRLPHWATVRLDRQVRLRLFETSNLAVIGESPRRALMLANGYIASEVPISPTAQAPATAGSRRGGPHVD